MAIPLLFLTSFFSVLNAQSDPGQKQADDFERKLLKDSLNFSEKIIAKIFEHRDLYFKRIQELDSNVRSSPLENRRLNKSLAENTNEGLREVLGDSSFHKYVSFIQRRMRVRRNEVKRTALAYAN